MSAKKRLGRGLGSLIGEVSQLADPPPVSSESSGLSELDVDQIIRGRYQPRRHFDEQALQDLAESIRSQGLVQPIVVRPQGQQFELIAGERRWRAAQLAGLQKIPVIVKALDDHTTAAVALVENIQREDLNPLEEAEAIKRLIDEFGLTHQQVAESVGRSRVGVSNLLRLLELTPGVKQMVDESRLSMGHARALLALQGAEQEQLARQIADQAKSVREAEAMIRRLQQAPNPKPQSASKDADVLRLEQELSEKLGAELKIQSRSAQGKGELVIRFHSLEQLQGIIEKIQ